MDLSTARILIVDDEPMNLRLLEMILRRDGYQHVVSTDDPRNALPLYEELSPDLLLLDLTMPNVDGFEVMRQIEPHTAEESYFPILILTGDTSRDNKQRALAGGAKDFLGKPFDHAEVLLRIRNLLSTRFLHERLADQNKVLEEKVRERTADLQDARNEVLVRLARAAEFRDDDTGEHIERVGRMAASLGRRLGLHEHDAEMLRQAAPLHDVGKIGIPDGILLKPGSLSADEFDRMRTHTKIGAGILAGRRFPVLGMPEDIAMTHHERWDGTGYPGRLRGEQIPLAGRIVAVADVYDALTSRRPYKEPWPAEKAVAEIERGSGKHFDPKVVDAFLRTVENGDLHGAQGVRDEARGIVLEMSEDRELKAAA